MGVPQRYWLGFSTRSAPFCHISKDGSLHQREERREGGLGVLLGVEETCAFTGLSAQDEKSRFKRKRKHEEFLNTKYIFLCIVEHQDRMLRVRRFEDG